MVLVTTHFALEGILLWEVIKEEDKNRWLRRQPLVILFLNLVAIAPDFDRAIGLHRGPVHSLFLVVAFLFITGVAYKSLKWLRANQKSINGFTFQEKYLHRLRFLVYAEMLWIVHILLDLDTPLALFWPLTDQIYQVNVFLVISVFPLVLFGIVILPYQILGIFTRVEQFTYVETLMMYISNMSVNERTTHFGSTIGYIPIANIVFQLLVLMLWILIVGRPLMANAWARHLKSVFRKFKAVNHVKTVIRRYSKHIQWDVLLFFVLLTSMGLLMGVESHPTKELIKYQGTNLIISPTTFKPLLGVDYERVSQLIPPPHSDLEIQYVVTHGHLKNITCDCYLFLMPTSISQELYVSLATLFYQYNISNETERTMFEAAYFKGIQLFIEKNPKYLVKMLATNDEKDEGVIFANLSSKFVSLVLILGKWQRLRISKDDTTIIKLNVSMLTNIIHHHEPIFYIGLAIQLLGFSGITSTVIIYPLVMIIRDHRKDRWG